MKIHGTALPNTYTVPRIKSKSARYETGVDLTNAPSNSASSEDGGGNLIWLLS